MRNIRKDVEQLEVAGELLDRDTPSTARLALFLIDNVAELMMYRRARCEFAKDSSWERVRTPRHAPKKKRDVLEYFSDKVNFFVNDVKLVEECDGHILSYCQMLCMGESGGASFDLQAILEFDPFQHLAQQLRGVQLAPALLGALA